MKLCELFEDTKPLTAQTKSRIGNRYDVRQKVDRGRHSIELHPNDAHNAVPYHPRPGRGERAITSYYDPSLSDMVDYDEDEPILHFRTPKAKAHLFTEIEPLPEKNVIYRGMSSDEYNNLLKTGYVKSHGDMNFPGQEGLTYWATDPKSAASYANSFAHMKDKPTFTRPAYVVATYRPEKTVHVKGTGENEVGVPIAIPKDEIIAVWRGKVYNFQTGEFSLAAYIPGSNGIISHDPDAEHSLGGGSSPSSDIVWERIL